MSQTGLKTILMIAYEDAAMLDIAAPLEVFGVTNRIMELRGRAVPYGIKILAEKAGACRTSSGMSINADGSWADWDKPVDTLMISGGERYKLCGNEAFFPWLKSQAARSRRIASVCTGAFVLAKGGFLNGRRATTHWQCAEELARAYPEIRVEPDSIYTSDNGVYTSAGVTAGMDLALALVEEDFGRKTALEAARTLVLYLKRTGGQSQFSTRLKSQSMGGGRLSAFMEWLGENSARSLRLEDLADRANMSLRTFVRVFKAESGTTPAKYIESLRLEHSVQLLEDTCLSLVEISDKCGFGDVDTFRRSFIKSYGVTPSDFRLRFGK